ncbi:MAG: hypothetical protein AAFX01_14340 [Cyanobacteria bacterium J06638_28]
MSKALLEEFIEQLKTITESVERQALSTVGQSKVLMLNSAVAAIGIAINCLTVCLED